MVTEDEVQLRTDNVCLSFGAVKALDGISLDVKLHQLLAVIGPNGAGKTCLFNVINGFYRPQEGEVYFEGRKITQLPPYKIAELGISRTFQAIQLYAGLSVVDNIMAGRHIHLKSGMVSGAIYFGRAQREEAEHRKEVEWLIDFLELTSVRDRIVGSLPYGLQKRVDLGRALALEPKLLLLDEPMAGMSRDEKEAMARFILDVVEMRGITVTLVEHDMGVVMDIADRVVVFDYGHKIADGLPEEIRNNEQVIKAYLGKPKEA
ncbi:MAG: ABC transporter ATP-binding protein [Dehalococcoidia bacterium]|nr:MAG: ABC transporter ATP-binding protein [Dehalococcoidia bacterium]